MKCSSCGTEIESGAARCPKCGAEACGDSAFGAAKRLKTDRSIRFYVMFGAVSIVMAIGPFICSHLMYLIALSPFNYFYGFLLGCLCGVAFAVYALCVFYRMIKEANIACEGDGEKTAGLFFFFLLNCVTLGVYSCIWWYKFGNRLAKNAPRYGMEFKKLGKTMLALKISGGLYALLCFVPYIIYDLAFSSEDPGFSEVFFFAFLLYYTMAACIVGVAVFHFILMGIAFKHTNRICAGYNAAHGLCGIALKNEELNINIEE